MVRKVRVTIRQNKQWIRNLKMIDFHKLGEFCARHGCADKYLRNVEDYSGSMPKLESDAIDSAFRWKDSPEKWDYWNKIDKLWIRNLKTI